MRILIVSKEVWVDTQNGGSTLTSLFACFPEDTEFAQIYCSDGIPDNSICRNYYKLTTKTVAKRILKKDVTGEKFCIKGYYNNTFDVEESSLNNKKQNKSFISKITNNEFFRDIVWASGKYKLPKLQRYITDYNPDIIFAPGYGVNYMNRLIQWICTFVDCPVVSLISDDYYSLNIRSLNPFYWLYLFHLRKNVRKSVKNYSLIYTMTDSQKNQLEKDFDKPVKILVKSAEFSSSYIEKSIESPIKLAYAGNLYFNRWKTLSTLAKAISELNKDYQKFFLDIYTNSKISDKFLKLFNIEGSSRIHSAVSSSELMEIYAQSDIALHVEGFDFLNKEKTRMSFSTKIMDCLVSRCAVMCICDERQGGYDYLSKNDAAICINSVKKIKDTLLSIVNNPDLINEYRKKAYQLGINNHNQKKINQEMYEDLNNLLWK